MSRHFTREIIQKGNRHGKKYLGSLAITEMEKKKMKFRLNSVRMQNTKGGGKGKEKKVTPPLLVGV